MISQRCLKWRTLQLEGTQQQSSEWASRIPTVEPTPLQRPRVALPADDWWQVPQPLTLDTPMA